MSKRAPIFAGVGVVVVLLLIVFLLVMPKRGDVSTAEEALATAQGQQTQLEADLDQLIALKQQAQETRRKLQKFATQIPPTADEPGLIRLMKLAADKSGVDLTVNSFSTPRNGDPTSISVNLNVTGTFFQIYDYLYRLETLPRVFLVQNISISGEWPLLGLTVSGLTYTTDSDSGPGSEVGPQTGTGGEA